MQQGEKAARNVLRQINSKEPEVFHYKDRGMLAVVGRNSAVGMVGKFNVTGLAAWLMWAGVHIFGIIGFRNRLQVLINWASAYLFLERPVHLIIPSDLVPRSPEVATKSPGSIQEREEAQKLLSYTDSIARKR
jgi:NADH dehydrogenase